jgi:lipopolysaccharide biosynthesis regulator YciM
MKKTILFSSAILAGFMNQAQTLQEAISKTYNDRYEVAASDFKKLIATTPTAGENYFYAGENYFYKGDLDSARVMYEKGVANNATNALNYVGVGKIALFNGEETKANENFFKAKTLSQNKNATVLYEIAEAYTKSPKGKNANDAVTLGNAAVKLDAKNPECYIALGDALLEQNPSDGSPAIKQYNKAQELNPKSVRAILRIGQLYARGKNYSLALDKYKEAEAIDATFAPAYLEKAQIYSLAGQDNKAVENLKKYLEFNNSFEARKRFAYSLFEAKKYQDVVNEVPALIMKDGSNPYLYRVLGYSYYDAGNATDKEAYTKGLSNINTFFDKAGPTFKYLASDYKYKALLLSKTGQDSVAVIEMKKAIALDPKLEGELSGDLANIYLKGKKYGDAIPLYKKKIAESAKPSSNDYFSLGRAYYFSKDFPNADSAFKKVTEISATFPTGYLYRGRANVYMDDANGSKNLALPHYTKYFELILPADRTKSAKDVIEACEYLRGHAALTLKDVAKAKEYNTIILELDPVNEKAKKFDANPNSLINPKAGNTTTPTKTPTTSGGAKPVKKK